MRKTPMQRFILPLLLTLGLVGCDQYDELFKIDLPNLISDSDCGTMTFHDKEARERCGALWDSFGFIYEKDQAALLILDTSDAVASDYTPTFKIWFDSRYLKAGQKLDASNARATCSRFKPELNNGDPTYFTVAAKNFALEMVEFKGEETDKITDDYSKWVFRWSIECPDLQMSHQGKDQINLSRDPVPNDWQRAEGKDYPTFQE